MKNSQVLFHHNLLNIVKSQAIFLFILASVSILTSCEEEISTSKLNIDGNEGSWITSNNGDRSTMKKYHFTFKFSSFGGPIQDDENICGDPPVFFIQQDGEGTGNLLGKFTFFSRFCNNLATGEFYGHKDRNVIFTAANGDKLFFGKEGEGSQIFPSDHPDYDLEFTGNPPIVGGTGRFEGATGTAMIESYVDLTAQRTDHVWTGTITLKK